MSNRSQSRIVVLTAPSGGGKTSISRFLTAAIPSLEFSVSATTRPPRSHEVDGQHYHFLTEAEFRDRLAADELIEHEEVYPGRFYGTLKSTVELATQAAPVLLDIEVRGAQAVKRMFGDEALAIFLMPPDLATLESRLRARGTDTDEDIAVRLDRSSMEMREADSFDAIVTNNDLERAASETIGLVRAFLARNH